MSNLIEKTLLIGFGIFSLTIFSSILIPFLGSLTEFNYIEKNKLESYMIIIDEISNGIEYVVQNIDEIYLKRIEYPDNLNISFYDNIAKYEFIIEGKICCKILEYNEQFVMKNFHQIPPNIYLLNITRSSILIKVNIINLN
ncbi:MAG: hypothetical protein ACFE9Q_05770 [Candidatus Hodarchaeota archaeon]